MLFDWFSSFKPLYCKAELSLDMAHKVPHDLLNCPVLLSCPAPHLRPLPCPYLVITLHSSHSSLSLHWYTTHLSLSSLSLHTFFLPCRTQPRDHWPGQNLRTPVPFPSMAEPPWAHHLHSSTLLHSPNFGQNFLRDRNNSKLKAVTILPPVPSMVLNLPWQFSNCGINEWIKKTMEWGRRGRSGRRESSSSQPGKTIQCPGVKRQQLQSRFNWHGSHTLGCVHSSRFTEPVPL